jgi:hypothetical protein
VAELRGSRLRSTSSSFSYGYLAYQTAYLSILQLTLGGEC